MNPSGEMLSKDFVNMGSWRRKVKSCWHKSKREIIAITVLWIVAVTLLVLYQRRLQEWNDLIMNTEGKDSPVFHSRILAVENLDDPSALKRYQEDSTTRKMVSKQESTTTENKHRILMFPEEKDILYFNRVPKTGSENMVLILQNLGEKNGFVHKRYGNPRLRQISAKAQENHAQSVISIPHRPLSYDRHIYFYNFSKFVPNLKESDIPIWFSFVRDPVEKFESRFHYARQIKKIYDELVEKNSSSVYGLTRSQWMNKDIESCVLNQDPECQLVDGELYDLAIPYFCGQVEECQRLNSEWAFEEAVKNIQRWYPTVGILEMMETSLKVAEAILPKFFQGAWQTYKFDLKESHSNKGRTEKKLSEKAKEFLRERLKMEQMFYEFVKLRLSEQYFALFNKSKNFFGTELTSTTTRAETASTVNNAFNNKNRP